MRIRSIAGLILAASAGCSSSDEPIDPLDRELVRELSLAQGTASGSAHAGTFTIEFSTDHCDCPNLEFDGQTVDICTLAELGGEASVELTEGSGVLAITAASISLTGAIEPDGSFMVAEIRNHTTLAGPIELLRRLDGQFSDANTASGWAGQRVLGELAGDNVDCRWIGSFVINRS
ncbi:MAG TPA: hypothetical protein VK034_00405 [Enhygromyxa sp.]|nr:hypothetical protein [Enhygromyxa sp.]